MYIKRFGEHDHSVVLAKDASTEPVGGEDRVLRKRGREGDDSAGGDAPAAEEVAEEEEAAAPPPAALPAAQPAAPPPPKMQPWYGGFGTDPLSLRTVTLETPTEAIDDGWRWRKYGEKKVHGRTHRRSYFKCSNGKCPARRHVERSTDDGANIVVTYEHAHDHPSPNGNRLWLPPQPAGAPPRASSDALRATAAAGARLPAAAGAGDSGGAAGAGGGEAGGRVARPGM